jgi:hypothetical protein
MISVNTGLTQVGTGMEGIAARPPKVLPENNTLFAAALRTISQLLDNGNSVYG